MTLNALIYTTLIDPLLSGLRRTVVENISQHSAVIDIACGPGTLDLDIARKAGHVTGIDLDEGLISHASARAQKKRISNLTFEVRDASDLSCYGNRQFDFAVTSMAVHQFPEELAVQILREMGRISKRVIIADYNCPMPYGFSKSLAYGIEYMAKGDHSRNFMNYMKRGGAGWFTNEAGLKISSVTIRGNGVFVVKVCDTK
ncbi:MAG: class I SAM-dependent methyltransferase [Bacteroidota bacterium]